MPPPGPGTGRCSAPWPGRTRRCPRSPASGPAPRPAAARRPGWPRGSWPRRPGRRPGRRAERTSAARCCSAGGLRHGVHTVPRALTVPLSVRRAMSARPAASAASSRSQAAAVPRRPRAACPAASRADSGYDEQAGGSPRPSLAEHGLAGPALTSASARRRHPVQHHGHHDVPRGRVQQQAPGHGVGIAVGGGDKHPQVGRRQQLPGELAVVVGDRVDVGSVQQRDPLRARPCSATRTSDVIVRGVRSGRRPGWQAAGPWPTTVPRIRLRPGRTRWSSNQRPSAGMVQQDGLAGGGPDGAGAGDGVAHERVDERRFPGTGGAAHDGQQRRVQAAVAGQDVVLELGHRVAGSPAVPARPSGRASGNEQRPGRGERPPGARRRLTAFQVLAWPWVGGFRRSSQHHHASSAGFRGRDPALAAAEHPPGQEISGKTNRPRADARSRSICDPSGIRTRVTAVRGQRTRPLYDGAVYFSEQHFCHSSQVIVSYT